MLYYVESLIPLLGKSFYHDRKLMAVVRADSIQKACEYLDAILPTTPSYSVVLNLTLSGLIPEDTISRFYPGDGIINSHAEAMVLERKYADMWNAEHPTPEVPL